MTVNNGNILHYLGEEKLIRGVGFLIYILYAKRIAETGKLALDSNINNYEIFSESDSSLCTYKRPQYKKITLHPTTVESR